MKVTKRLLGISLILVGGLVFIDWVYSFVLWGGLHQPIVDLILHGDLDTSESQPILFTLWIEVCPGNGHPAFCDPLGWFFLVLGVLAVVTCLLVNLTRGVALTKDRSVRGKSHWLRLHNLAFYTSAVVAAGLCWTWIHVVLGSDYPTAVSVVYLVVATITPPLFVVVTVVTGRRLLTTRLGKSGNVLLD